MPMMITSSNRLPGRTFLKSQAHPTSVRTDLPTVRRQMGGRGGAGAQGSTQENEKKNDTLVPVFASILKIQYK